MLVVGVALAGFLLSVASLPHSHAPSRPGVYNQEHDLTNLAAFGGAAAVAEAPSAALFVLVVVLAVAAAPSVAPVTWRRHADFRAPPLR